MSHDLNSFGNRKLETSF